MSENVDGKKDEAPRSTVRATWALVVIGFLGLAYAGYELREIRHQNEVSDLAFRQSIRPTAVLFTNENSPDSVLIELGYSKEKLDRFGLSLRYLIENNGEGA